MSATDPSCQLRERVELARERAQPGPLMLGLVEADELLSEIEQLRARAHLAEHDLGIIRSAYRSNGQAREHLRARLASVPHI